MQLWSRRSLAALTLVLLGFVLLPARAAAQALSVEITVEGPDSERLSDILKGLSELQRLKEQGAASLGTVRRLASGDAERFEKALHTEGYYAGRVEAAVSMADEGYRAEFTVTPGARFHVTAYEIRYTDRGPTERPTTPAALDVDTDGSPRGADIIIIQQDVLSRLRAAGYPSAQITERRAEVILGATDARLVFMTQSGLLASFGPTEWPKGLRTRTDYLDEFVPWKQGERFNLDQTAQLRDDLSDTGLFTVVAVEPGPTAPDGTTPVEVALTERKPRTFGAGLSYSTNLGFGAQASWLHRNYFRRAERLETSLDVSQVAQTAKVEFQDPRVFKKTDLVLATSLKNEDSQAFSGVTLDNTAELHYKFDRELTGKAGVEFFASRSEDTFGTHRSYLVGFPIGATYTTVNNVLNPTRGISASLTFKPYVGSSSGAVTFSQLEGTFSYHLPFDKAEEFVGAVWTRAGASLGPGVSAIPPDKRYYAGGAGSVRGFGYRLLGPTDANGDPIGGRSILAGGGELRFPIRGDFGGAAFVEGGGVSESGLFVFDEGVRYGAGLGLRYYTAVGPIRVDIAVPLQPRSGIDDAVQFYVSLGQAF